MPYWQLKKVIQEPFIVINADDYYGKEAFVKIHDYLVEEKPAGNKMDILYGRLYSGKYFK